MYVTVSVSSAQLGVNIGGTDYDCGYLYFSQLSIKSPVSCSIVVTGLTAGSKTLQMRWKRGALGTGTLNSATSADWNNMSVMETN
jgi:hypothetical protein